MKEIICGGNMNERLEMSQTELEMREATDLFSSCLGMGPWMR